VSSYFIQFSAFSCFRQSTIWY